MGTELVVEKEEKVEHSSQCGVWIGKGRFEEIQSLCERKHVFTWLVLMNLATR